MKMYKWEVVFNVYKRHKDKVNVLGETEERARESFKFVSERFISPGDRIEVVSVFKKDEHKELNQKQMSFDIVHKGENDGPSNGESQK